MQSFSSISQSTRTPSQAFPATETGVTAEKPQRDILLVHLQKVWHSQLNVARDLPRLTSRLVIRDFHPEANVIENLQFNNSTLAQNLEAVITEISRRLETPEQHAKVTTGLRQSLRGVSPGSDIQLILENAFNAVCIVMCSFFIFIPELFLFF